MRISDWSSDVCSSDLAAQQARPFFPTGETKTVRTRDMRENRWNPLAGAASVTRRQVTKSAGALGLLAFIAPARAPARRSWSHGLDETITNHPRMTTYDTPSPTGQADPLRERLDQGGGH